MRRINIIAVLLLACCSVTTQPCTAGITQEFTVKAGLLMNISMFTEWPPATDGYSSFTIGVIGDTPIYDILETMSKKRIKNRPVVIRRLTDLSQSSGFQVLFIAASERYRLQQLLPEAHRRGIMTISDMRNFTKLGGAVSLVTVNERITFELNLAAARTAKVSFSSQLLRLANDITN